MEPYSSQTARKWWGAALLLAVMPALFVGCGQAVSKPGAKGGQQQSAKQADPEDERLPQVLRGAMREVRESFLRDEKGEPITELFSDRTPASGIKHTYKNGQEAEHFSIMESLGGGVALIDYDRDGLLDIYLTGGGYYDGPDKQLIKGHPSRFYKNLGGFRFRDLTGELGLDKPVFYTHGASTCDYDRDGWPDLLVTGWGRMALYHNQPDGKGGRRFVEVTRESGLPENLWTTSAGWADLDGDGYPDLYVCQYVNWSFKNNPSCGGYSSKIKKDVCPPKSFTGLPHALFRNNGNGKFTDVSKEAKIRPHTGDVYKDAENGKGLGVVIVDVDMDSKPDIYVANDTVDNFLYMNQCKPGRFLLDEVGLQSGTARDDRGVSNGSMGVDAADLDGKGLAWLFCANYENEMHGLYRNLGRGLFLFSTPASGMSAIGQLYVGFGSAFFDIDNHGWEDLMVSNGHVIRFPQGAGLKQRPVVLRNKGAARFVDITRQGGEYFRSEHMGRGLAIGDLDNDGRYDLVISHLNDPAVILRNEADLGNNWLGIEVTGADHRDVVGGRIVLELMESSTTRKLTRFIKGGTSYLSSIDRRHIFGLGSTAKIKAMTVFWPPSKEHPMGHAQQFTAEQLKPNRYWRIMEGKESPQPPSWSASGK